MESLLRRDLIKTIERYQYSIQHVNPPDIDPQRVLHYLRKLSKLPIKLAELEKTGIGKTVNSLRKYRGSIGDEAGLLVGKWKAIAIRQVVEEDLESCKQNDADSLSDKDSPSNEYNYKTSKSSSTSTKLDLEKVRPVKSIQEITLKPIKHKTRPVNDRKRSRPSDENKFERNEKYAKLEPRSCSEDENYADEPITRKEPARKSINVEDRLRNNDRSSKRHESREDNVKKQHESSKSKGHHTRDYDRSSHLENNRDRTNSSMNKEHSDEEYDSMKNSKSSSKYLSNESIASPINDYYSDSDDYYDDDDDDDEPINSTDEDFGAALLGISKAVTPVKNANAASKYSSSIPSSPGTNSPRNSGSEFDALSSSIKMEPLDEIDLDELEEEEEEDTKKFNDNSLSTRRSQRRKEISKEEAQNSMTMMTTSKTQRTKVFSGCKSKVTMKCPTLFELCTRVLQDNFDYLEYTGGVPYDVLRPVLEKVTAEQLYNFEQLNPYLIGETDELWEYHAARHFRRAKRLHYETWRDLYMRCVEERDEKLQTVRENISQSIANSAPVRKTKLAYLDTTQVKPPRNVAKSQVKNGTSPVAVKRPPKGPQPSPAAVQSVKERLAQQSLAAPQAVTVSSKNSLNILKKKKAPLMMKSLQLLKGMKR